MFEERCGTGFDKHDGMETIKYVTNLIDLG
jgi:hypothetical protein